MQYDVDAAETGDLRSGDTDVPLSRRRVLQAGAMGLLVGATGPVAAQEGEEYVDVSFETIRHVDVHVDEVANESLTGRRWWRSDLWSKRFESGAPIAGLGLVLDTGLEFDHLHPEPDSWDPPTWSFGDVPVGEGVSVNADPGSHAPPATFEPGFDARREFSQVRFDEPGTQTMTLTVVPREEMATLGLNVTPGHDPDVLEARIVAVDGPGKPYQAPDEVRAAIDGPTVGQSYEWTVTIEVDPTAGTVEFVPNTTVGHDELGEESGSQTGSSITRSVPDLGAWQWRANSDYEWQWRARSSRLVMFYSMSHALTANAGFITNWRHDVEEGSTFMNAPVGGRRHWGSYIGTDPDGPVVESLGLVLDSALDFDRLEPLPESTNPPTWEYGDLHPGGKVEVHVDPRDPPTGTITPGFDATRTVDRTVFDEAGTQHLEVTVTLDEPTDQLNLHIGLDTDDAVLETRLDSAVGPGVEHADDWAVQAFIENPTTDTYTWTVDIDVTPHRPEVVFLPGVNVQRGTNPARGTSTGAGITRDVPDLGTWRWETANEYEWYWQTHENFEVGFDAVARDLANHVGADFGTLWRHRIDGDEFEDAPVTVTRSWHGGVGNHAEPDRPGEALRSTEGVVDSPLAFARLDPEPDETDPVTWRFGDLPPDAWRGVGMQAGEGAPEDVVDLDLDVVRSLDRETFEAPSTQTVTVSVTPYRPDDLFVHVEIPEHALEVIDAGIADVRGPGQYEDDGRQVDVGLPDPEVGRTYTWNVDIDVDPGDDVVQFAPEVAVSIDTRTVEGQERGDHVTRDLPDLGPWTWSGDGEYVWHWSEFETRRVNLADRLNRPPTIEAVTADPTTLWPPNGKERDVTVAVVADDPDGDLEAVVFEVADEYGEYDTTLTTAVEGWHAHLEQVIPLDAARKGGDPDGRTYTITVTATDENGLTATDEVVVTVPHDQR